MSNNKIIFGGLIGGAVYFLLGFVFYGMLFMDFFAKNTGSATGVMKEPMDWWALILGNILWGCLLAVIFGKWAGIRTMQTGAMAGALLGFLAWGAMDFTMLGTTNIGNLTSTIVDIALGTVVSAIVGAVIGWFYGLEKA
jgi:uncharacterized membrane protein